MHLHFDCWIRRQRSIIIWPIYIYKWKNQCVLFDSFTYIYSALLPQHWALYAKVDSTPTYIYIYVWIRSLCLIFPFYSARYVEEELDVYWDREKTEREYFHPYKSVSWLLTHKGILIFLLHFSYYIITLLGMYKVSGSVCALWNWIFFH